MVGVEDWDTVTICLSWRMEEDGGWDTALAIRSISDCAENCFLKRYFHIERLFTEVKLYQQQSYIAADLVHERK